MHKKIRNILFIIAISIIIYPLMPKAAGYMSVSPSSLSIEEGSTATFTITVFNAIGDGSIVSNNPSVATVSTGTWDTGMVGDNETRTTTVTVTGISEGSTTISVNVRDSSIFDGGTLTAQSVFVNVRKKPTVINVPPSNPTPSNNTTNNDNQTPTNNTTSQENEKSTNNKLKELTSDYGKIVKIDDNHYTLQIPSNIEEVTIKAVPEDNKAKVTGDGKHKIKVGSNTIEMIITSESGEENKISLIVTRKDAYYIEDLETVLQTSQEKELSFKITPDSKITPNQLTSIKKSGKKITLDYYDSNNRLIYSWIIDGSKISNIEEMPTKVLFKSNYEKEIKEQLKDTDNIYLTLSSDIYPEGTRLRVYVGDKYKDNDKIKIYLYDKETKKLKLITTDKVKSGYVEFTVSKGSSYVLVREEEVKEEKKTNSTIPIIFLGFSLIVLIMSILIYKKKTSQKKDK